MKPKIKIAIASDVVCPWCYIGKRRIEKAIDQLQNDYDFDISYLPFELNPGTPKEGYNQKEYLTNKFGGEERYEQITSNVTSVAAQDGLKFDFNKQLKSPNTLDSHRIIWFAEKTGKQRATVEAFFKAYFEDGVDLTKKENLISVATSAGLEAEKVKALLESDEGLDEVKESERFIQGAGVSGVPFYIINDKYGISGAQPADVFVKALKDIASETPLQGESCDVDGKNC
ncbi:MAG: DsbA family oxidoreductase [Sporocytophaga sp.]|nr:DsbA family oxidoreductase [Sporocytophaga sp.]